jgi:hypothetical protein
VKRIIGEVRIAQILQDSGNPVEAPANVAHRTIEEAVEL